MSEAPKPDAATVERFRAVVLPHLDAAYGFARWLARDPVLAQDLAQEAMLRALRYFHAFRGEEARPWLLRIMRNTWSDLRARKGMSDRPLDEIDDRPADAPDPEQSALAGDRRRGESDDDIDPTDPSGPGLAIGLLREAAAEHRPVWLQLVGPDGSTSRRRVRPLRVDAGRVRLLDLDREAELTVAVHRIVDVTP